MAGFGRKLLAGLAAGGANYYGAKYKEQEEDRKSAALLLREQALAHTRSMLNREEKVEAGKVEALTYRDKRTADVDYENATLPAKTSAEITVAERKAAAEQKSRERILDLTHGYTMTEIGERGRVDAARAVAAANEEVDRFVVARDGSGVFYNKKGRKIAQTPPGAFDRPNERKPTTSDDSFADLRIPERGSAAASPPAKTAKAERWQDYVETAKELVGDGASQAVVERKARELAERYGG